MSISLVDWVFGAILLFSLLLGAWRGLIFEVLSAANWIAAFFLAQWFAMDVALLMPAAVSGETFR